MRKTTRKTSVLVIVGGFVTCTAMFFLSTTSAMAGGITTSGNVVLASDFVWRGVSQTNEEPAIQGSLNFAHESGFYAGIWGSNVEFGDSAQLELDLYAGFSKELGNGLSIDIGVVHYEYPGALSSLNYDFEEYYLGLGYNIQKVALSTKLSYAPEFAVSNKSAHYLEGGISYELPAAITVSGHYGYSDGDSFDNSEYSDYSIGFATELAGIGVDISGYGNDIDGNAAVNDDRVVLSISKSF